MVKVYSYVVTHDYGFAPNPHGGYCTLACCKPRIRSSAGVGDLIVGTGSRQRGRGDRLVYAMRVSEAMSFTEYWDDPRFRYKRPDMTAGDCRRYGDNAYRRDEDIGVWRQVESHHSEGDGGNAPCGIPPCGNAYDDTRVDRVLIGEEFIYWGGDGPPVRPFAGVDIRAGRGHRSRFEAEVVAAVVEWLDGRGEWGRCGDPLDAKVPCRCP